MLQKDMNRSDYICPYCGATVIGVLRRAHVATAHNNIRRSKRVALKNWKRVEKPEAKVWWDE